MNLGEIYDGQSVTMESVLQSRTDRAMRQQAQLQAGRRSLVSFTLNIPGEVKQFSLAREAFQVGLAELRLMFAPHIVNELLTQAKTGNEALISLTLPPEQAKREVMSLEEYHPLGRLFDMDVLGPDGCFISRSALGLTPRRCLLCAESAKVCARSGAHSAGALRAQTAHILDGYFRDRAANRLASCATRALLYEVSATPKPGLVDRANSGSHPDMDYFTFLDSISALSPWMREMFCIGWDHKTQDAAPLFFKLRHAGKRAEQDMLRATGGVNTHKGLIFSMGLLCGAMGALQSGRVEPVSMEETLSLCSRLGRCALEDFSADTDGSTNGLMCFHNHRITGARGEAALGFPTAARVGLPSLRRFTSKGLSLNDAAAVALLHLMAHATDTNMIRRGGLDRARQCKAQAARFLEGLTKGDMRQILNKLDQQYIRENLSPGGCADLLALSLTLFFLEKEGLILPDRSDDAGPVTNV